MILQMRLHPRLSFIPFAYFHTKIFFARSNNLYKYCRTMMQYYQIVCSKPLDNCENDFRTCNYFYCASCLSGKYNFYN